MAWRRTTLLINLASVMERVDEQVLGGGETGGEGEEGVAMRAAAARATDRSTQHTPPLCSAFAPPIRAVQLLPALYAFVGHSFHATPRQLGTLTMARAIVQAGASPLAGVLGQAVSRVWVIAGGAALWGAMCLGFATTHSVHQVRVCPQRVQPRLLLHLAALCVLASRASAVPPALTPPCTCRPSPFGLPTASGEAAGAGERGACS
jgi:hypothetical protein